MKTGKNQDYGKVGILEGVIVSEGDYVGGKKIEKWTWYEKGKDTGWEENYTKGLLDSNFYNLSPHSPNRGKGVL